MGMIETRLRARGWKSGALTAIVIALATGCSASSADEATASAPAPAAVAQATSDDPCRYLTAQEVGKVFDRPMKSSNRVSFCEYRGAGSDMVVVKVATGTEGTILRHERTASAAGQKGAEKVPAAAGEAYFDTIIPVFIGRVGNREVQIETTIEPVPREAMIAVGTRIMETLSRK